MFSRFFASISLFALTLCAEPAGLDRARSLYERTDYRAALQLLTAGAITSGPVLELTGKSYFMLGDFKKAGEAFEKSITLEGGNSVYHHWLGKAYGRRAETASPFSAPGLALKARRSFERAVELDSRNIEAASDLFEYYLEAPGFLGGGMDKAAALASRMNQADPVEHHYALAQIAERRKEFNTAEQHFRRAMELAPGQVGRVIDLAKFLSSRGREQESEAAFAQAEKIAPSAPKLLFERASVYIKSRRNLPMAKAMLEKYLRSTLTPDDPSREEAARLLKQASGV